ncbi:MAG: hypothetical protein AVDCRST_MAG96-4277 [uncultured Segetibacter sp.]|uniref:Uncharacterized protein n=1 Tax=uncultured Segetibacter sp. TaxID=481133 RepID=A0A6J4U4S7_9BACT|nr:MAG: hypothetical protein AVDCRST_MAG96-4277 [uncultured Segetibacter sp.]
MYDLLRKSVKTAALLEKFNNYSFIYRLSLQFIYCRYY